jgi:ATP-dependent Clp protease ATP-binding subunit ClpA
MRPEFINRIDEIITFRPLDEQDFEKISKIMLGDLKSALSARGIKFEYTDAVCAYVAEKSFSRKFGARNMRRFIQTNIEDRLANAIIFENKAPIEAAAMDVKDGELTLQYI